MSERIREKLQILADAAKYDVSCSSSGSQRKNQNKGLGDASQSGICHTFTEDGRCVSLLKTYLAMSVFMTAPIVCHDARTMSNEQPSLCKKWLI